MSRRLSVIIPVFNEREKIAPTLTAAAAELSGSFDTEFIVVDDGSTDGSAAAARASGIGQLSVIEQPNQGRLGARRRGLKAATGDLVLFLDSRVRIEAGSAAFLAAQIERGKEVWNAHVDIETRGNPYGRFWKVLTELAFSSYFDRPRTTSYGVDDFDAYPKGTTCFLAPVALMRRAFEQVDTRYADERNANDDTPILRWVATEERINISPAFRCRYWPRSTMRGFIRHAEHRGVVFLDGHGRRESRFFPAVIAFYVVSIPAMVMAVRRPATTIGLVAAGATAAGGLAVMRGKQRDDAAIFAALIPIYAVAHGFGMWKGLALALANRFEGGRPT